MAWTNPSTAVAGSTALTAAFWNEQVKDNSTYLKAETDGIGMVLLDNTSFSAVASVTVSNVFSSTYSAYRLVIDQNASSSGTPRFKLAASGTPTRGNEYDFMHLKTWSNVKFNVGGSESIYYGPAPQFDWSLSSLANTANRDVYGIIELNNPANASKQTYGVTQSSNAVVGFSALNVGAFIHTPTSAYDGFQLLISTGTITGSVRTYGMRDA